VTWKPQAPTAPTDVSALRKEIEAERAARIEAKIAAGTAVRSPPVVVGIADPKRDYAAVYRDADGREVYPQGVVITGVPRQGRDDGLPVPTSTPWPMAVEMKPVERKAPPLPQPAPELPTEGPRHPVRWTARAPDEEKRDPGQVIEASYSITGNVLRVYDETDRLLGTDRLQPGDVAAHAARRLLKWRLSRFDPLSRSRRLTKGPGVGPFITTPARLGIV
jgi:hypothetical protein